MCSKRIKVGVGSVFRHLVDVMALWHTNKVFESMLNNLKVGLSPSKKFFSFASMKAVEK